jgi:phosphoribosyl 1,2-cyclic phosphate phosphodiesterase
MKVTFLGTGTSHGVPMLGCHCSVCTSADSRNVRTRPSVLIQAGGQVVIDTSTDFRFQMMKHRIERLDAVLYTHWHADHIFGLDDIRPFNYLQRSAIPIYGNRQTLDQIKQTFSYIFDGAHYEGSPRVEPRTVEGPFSVRDLYIEPLSVTHGRLEILGYKVGRFAYITDASSIPEGTIKNVENIPCLVLNALRHKPHFAHFSVEQALEQIERINPSQAFLTHISHQLDHAEVEKSLPTHVRLAYDGLSLEL